MKLHLVLIGLFSIVNLFFNNWAVQANNNQDDFSDLAIFGEQIKNKRIIYLDELTHGEHEVYALKTRLIKYLHQQHNFNVLLLESGLYDVSEIDKKSANSDSSTLTDLAPGNIFFGYAKDPGFTELLAYIDQQRQQEKPLHLSGFDGRLSGEHSITQLVSALKSVVNKYLNDQQKPADWPAYANLLQASLDRKSVALTDEQKVAHIKQTYHLITALEAIDTQPTIDSPSYFAQLLKGIIRLFEVEHNYRRFDEHDLVMASNINWLMTHVYPAQKVIVWGHFVHVNRKGYLDLNYDNVATRLSSYGYSDDAVYHVNIAGLSGHYRDFIDGSVKPLPSLTNNHLAFELSKQFSANNSTLFVHREQFSAPQFQHKTLYGFNYLPSSLIEVQQWGQYFDGVFLLNQVTPSTY